MNSREERRKAFARADAILSLEGMEKPTEAAALQTAVIDGRMTFDQAVKEAIEQAKRRSEGQGG